VVENSCSPEDFARRQKLFEDHERKWSNAGTVARAVHKLPKGLSFERRFTTIHGKNLISSHGARDSGLNFLRLSSATIRKPIECWSIPSLPFGFEVYAVYPPDSILAVAEEKER